MEHRYHHSNTNNNSNNQRIIFTPNSNSYSSLLSNNDNNNHVREYPKIPQKQQSNEIFLDHNKPSSSELLHDRSQEITWLFFRDSKWIPFQSNNHHKIEQAFALGGIYVDINDINFPHLKSIRVFPTRMYLSYLGMKYRLSCVIQGS
ncbi:MAG: hypothetical protein EXX96DRAFT_587195 [Benjaminiella poitrasii]|nr:MAG: hypothetical protein EXX96DRAFT_587195 [Benjaminiella poitrasii]